MARRGGPLPGAGRLIRRGPEAGAGLRRCPEREATYPEETVGRTGFSDPKTTVDRCSPFGVPRKALEGTCCTLPAIFLLPPLRDPTDSTTVGKTRTDKRLTRRHCGQVGGPRPDRLPAIHPTRRKATLRALGFWVGSGRVSKTVPTTNPTSVIRLLLQETRATVGLVRFPEPEARRTRRSARHRLGRALADQYAGERDGGASQPLQAGRVGRC
jgi:hypothetical protein